MNNHNIINKLTGLNISDELADILDELDAGKEVDIERICRTVEIEEAETCLIDIRREENKEEYYSKRSNLHNNIISKIEKNGAIGIDRDGNRTYNNSVLKNGRLDIVIGLPGSGKSSTLVIPISEKYCSRVIDSDDIKAMLPEYNNGWGATIVHEESKLILSKIMSRALNENENIVLPIVGSKYNSVLNNILKAKDNGYKVYLHMVDIPYSKAMSRMIKRFCNTGRYIPPLKMKQYEGGKIESVYEKLKNSNYIDGYSKWNNDVKYDEKPKLIDGKSPLEAELKVRRKAR